LSTFSTTDETGVSALEVSVLDPLAGEDTTVAEEFGTVVTVGAVVTGGEVVVVDPLGVTAALIFEYEPVLTLETAATRKRYDAPLSSPVMVLLVVVLTVSFTVVHAPESLENSMT
jgi:hypothetical protein